MTDATLTYHPKDAFLPEITAVLTECFADPAVARVVVEPDARNTRVHALNAAVGFVVEAEVRLADKTALLSTCTRAAFERSSR